jgi:hypothetical protein
MVSAKKPEEMSIIEIETKIAEYKNNLCQIENILDREKEKSLNLHNPSNISRINELIKVQKDLKNAIYFHEELKKFSFENNPAIFNLQALDLSMNGKICQAFYEADSQWYLAMINEVILNDKTAEITWLGYKEKMSLPWAYIKVQPALKKEQLEVGMFCDAIYYEEGKWYQASIEMISEHGVHVKYKKYEDVEVVSFDSIRITPQQNLLNMKRKEESLKNKKDEELNLEFKLPDYLKINPADSEIQRLTKRKRVKALKNSHKQKVMEIISKEKQDNWLNFSLNANKLKSSGITPMKKVDKKLNDI